MDVSYGLYSQEQTCIWKLTPKPARKDPMARPRAFDETEVLRSLEDVFWRQGYEATSYDDLMRASRRHFLGASALGLGASVMLGITH